MHGQALLLKAPIFPQVEVRVPDGTAAIAAVPVAELKFRLGWIARCAMQLGHQGWIAQIEQHPRTKRLA